MHPKRLLNSVILQKHLLAPDTDIRPCSTQTVYCIVMIYSQVSDDSWSKIASSTLAYKLLNNLGHGYQRTCLLQTTFAAVAAVTSAGTYKQAGDLCDTNWPHGASKHLVEAL